MMEEQSDSFELWEREKFKKSLYISDVLVLEEREPAENEFFVKDCWSGRFWEIQNKVDIEQTGERYQEIGIGVY